MVEGHSVIAVEGLVAESLDFHPKLFVRQYDVQANPPEDEPDIDMTPSFNIKLYFTEIRVLEGNDYGGGKNDSEKAKNFYGRVQAAKFQAAPEKVRLCVRSFLHTGYLSCTNAIFNLKGRGLIQTPRELLDDIEMVELKSSGEDAAPERAKFKPANW